MGSKHPISLKFKHCLNWNSTTYKFDQKNLLNISDQEVKLSALLRHYFQSLLISKPIFKHFAKVLLVTLYCYSKTKTQIGLEFGLGFKKLIRKNKTKLKSLGKLKKRKIKIKMNRYGLNKKINPYSDINRLKKLEIILTKIHGKKVKLKLIKLKNPTLNSSILGQYLFINSTHYSISGLWRKLLKKVRLSNQKLCKSPSVTFNWNNLMTNGYSFLFNRFISYIIGIKLKISGRFSKRKGASRTKVKNYSIGSFKFNSASSLIDYGLTEKKNKNGSQSIKVFTASIIFK